MTGKLAVLDRRRTTLMCLGSGELSRQTNTGEWLICHYQHGLLKKLGIESKFEPIRGGTDGATLSFNGIVCPNLGTGCGNYHGPYEFADLDDMETMVEVILTMFSLV